MVSMNPSPRASRVPLVLMNVPGRLGRKDAEAVVKMVAELSADLWPVPSGLIAFSGYDDDPRSVYEIPACRESAVALIAAGILPVLRPTARNRDEGLGRVLLGDHIPDTPDASLGLGGFELWALAKGLMTVGVNRFSTDEVMQFMTDCWGELPAA